MYNKIILYLLSFFIIISANLFSTEELLDFPKPEGKCNEYPDIAVDKNGILWTSYLSVRGRLDGIFAKYYKNGTWSEEYKISTRIGTEWRPQFLIDNNNIVWIFWSAMRENNWDIYARKFDGSTWSEELRITDNASIDYNQDVKLDREGNIHLVWVSFRDGNTEIYHKSLINGVWSKELNISQNDYPDNRPSITFDKENSVWIAYDSFRSRNYDFNIFLRQLKAGTLADEIQVTTHMGLDFYPCLASTDDGYILIAHLANHVQNKTQLRLLAFDGSTWYKLPPENQNFISESEFSAGHPSLQVDKNGIIKLLWENYDKSQTYFRAFSQGEWSEPQLFRANSGMGYHPFPKMATAPDGTIYVIREEGNHGEQLKITYLKNAFKDQNSIKNILIPTEIKPPRPLPSPSEKEHKSISINGNTYYLYYGDIHQHSSLSDGRYWPDIAYMFNHSKFLLDFSSTADHDSSTPHWLSESEWQVTQISSKTLNQPGKYVTLCGFEYRVSKGRPGSGDRNIYYPSEGFSIYRGSEAEYNEPLKTFEQLKKEGQKGIQIPHHPTRDFAPVDWTQFDPVAQPLVEISSGHGISEYDFCPEFPKNYSVSNSAHNALMQGIKIGFISSSDTHGFLWMPVGFAGVWAKSLSRKDIFEALSSRRTIAIHAVPGKNKFASIDFRINNTFMGREITISPKDEIKITVEVIAPTPIEKVEIIKNENLFYYTYEPDTKTKEVNISYTDKKKSKQKTDFYYIRIKFSNTYAWASPIWVTKK